MKITRINATKVTVPLEAPLRHDGTVPGSYPYDQDALRPVWTPTIPSDRWADPQDSRQPENILF